MDTWIWVLLAAVVLLAAAYFINLGWFSRHPWPGSTREELDEQMKKTHDELERRKQGKHPAS